MWHRQSDSQKNEQRSTHDNLHLRSQEELCYVAGTHAGFYCSTLRMRTDALRKVGRMGVKGCKL